MRVEEWMQEHQDDPRTDKCDVVIDLHIDKYYVKPSEIRAMEGYAKLKALSTRYGMDVYLYHVSRHPVGVKW